MSEAILNRMNERSAVVGVIGLGYVGLPLAVEFGRAGLKVIGFDLVQNDIEVGPQQVLGYVPPR